MAVASTNETFTHSLGHRVAGLFNAIGHAFVAMAEASPRMKKLEQLSSMTDEELAAKGMASGSAGLSRAVWICAKNQIQGSDRARGVAVI